MKRHKRFTFALRDLLVPETWHNWRTLEQEQKLLEVFRWMVGTASHEHYRGDSVRRTAGAQQLLNGRDITTIGYVDIRPLGADWKQDLERRFHYALMSSWASAPAVRWRTDHQIDLATVRQFTAPWIEDWEGTNGALSQLLSAKEGAELGEPLRWQLNPFHEKAVAIHGIALAIAPRYRAGRCLGWLWSFVLSYGYSGDRYCSWTRVLAAQEPGEPLLETMERAYRQLRTLQGKELGPALEPMDGYDLVTFSLDAWADVGVQKPLPSQIWRESFRSNEYQALIEGGA